MKMVKLHLAQDRLESINVAPVAGGFSVSIPPVSEAVAGWRYVHVLPRDKALRLVAMIRHARRITVSGIQCPWMPVFQVRRPAPTRTHAPLI